MFENNDFEIDSQSSSSDVTFRKYVLKTFSTMALGLLISVISALVFMYSGIGYVMFSIPFFPIILLVAEIGVVVAFSARLLKASAASAKAMFFIYAILTGFTFCVVGVAYAYTDITLAFVMTCVYFTSLVAIGYTTKINLARFAPILFTGLIILIIFNVIAFFMNIDGMQMIICSIGLLIFTGITAYDAQKMKRLYEANEGNPDMLERLSIYSALELYLDFVNIFLYILRLLGNRK